MTETPGDQPLDTGTGAKPVSVLSGHAAESPERGAWRAYLHHRPGCLQCNNTPVLCETGRRLWGAYKAAGHDH